MMYRTAEECREANVTYHLCPIEVWERHQDELSYLPEPFELDGFIHCTNGLDELIKVGDMFYTAENRPLTVLVIDVPAVGAPVRYDDPNETYPHIYGPLNTDAVVGQLSVERDADGRFVEFTPVTGGNGS